MTDLERILQEISDLRTAMEELRDELRLRGSRNTPKPPKDLSEVQQYYSDKCDKDSSWLTFDVEKFYDFYAAAGWIKTNKLPILSWKSQMSAVKKAGWCEVAKSNENWSLE